MNKKLQKTGLDAALVKALVEDSHKSYLGLACEFGVIEPTTMCYADSASVTITVGWGDTAATNTTRYGPWAGVCEKVPNPN